MTMNLTPHFSLAEMTVSEWASRNGVSNNPGEAETAALKLLCEEVLEPIRANFGLPVIVTSGYRSPRVNKAIKGAPTSQHVKGQAADIRVPGIPNLTLCRWVHQHLNYDQLIYEFGETGWCHVSFDKDRMRNMELSAKRQGGKTVYLQGIVA
jgi:zinc D-Ala-D-Ala carboxypeptidase